ncbi:MAG: Lon protease family protein [Thermoanaerobaculia bacterium]
MAEALPPDRLRNACDPSKFDFATTADLAGEAGVPGQGRAEDAIRFALDMASEGFNVYAMGSAGLGKHEIVRRILDEKAASGETPSDWCYVHDFESGQKPRALKLPAGRAAGLARSMERLVEGLRGAIPAAFETDEYRAHRQEIDAELSEKQEKAFDEVRGKAREKGLDLVRMPMGMALAPLKDGEVMDPEVFGKLPEVEQKRIGSAIAEMQGTLEKVIHTIPRWRREAGEKVRELNRAVIRAAVRDLVLEVRKTVEDLPEVQKHLAALEEDVLSHAEGFLPGKEGEAASARGLAPMESDGVEAALRRYRVNVLVDHAATKGAPVVALDHATFPNLIGRIEHLSQMGNLVTDFTLIRPGALHNANGGYLMLDVLDVLSQPLSWGALKRALRAGSVRVELPGQSMGLMTTGSLEPELIPLSVKVVLVGDRHLYYLLHEHDPEFPGLFKVAADFEEDVPRDDGGVLAFARLVAAFTRQENLLPLERGAVARLVEHASRKAEDGEKLSLKLRDLDDLLREADSFARKDSRSVTAAVDVERALDGRERRADRIRMRILDDMVRGTLLIDTSGERAGQVNALSVLHLGSASFGHPTRVTARVRLGSGKVVDILREVEMGGPNHTKGVLILGGFLAGRYMPDRPLSLSASLVLEQSYGGVEGDSASSAELYALLSALAEAPIRQSFAVTGSVNQHGEVQPIGGVNEKIEGFFDLCARRGLTGEQGVLIPRSNVPHLVLRKDVVAAAAAGRFRVFPVSTIDEGLEILTGLNAGERGADGRFPEGSVNGRVEERLAAFAKAARAFAKPEENAKEGK